VGSAIFAEWFHFTHCEGRELRAELVVISSKNVGYEATFLLNYGPK
jgi:hypothetical protein